MKRIADNTARKGFMIKMFSLLASWCLMMASVLPSSATEKKTYTYTVTFSAGNQGTLRIADGVSISVDGGGDYEISLSEDGKTVKITGLTEENSIRFLNSAVSLDSGSKYYVKGVRMSGRDNNTVALSYFSVERDQDYVVAYGIRGNLVQYTINYVDQNGKELYPSQVYYGNVGDMPVVAYLYVEGYQPQAYNLTGTLQSDASRNIFTFVYRPVATQSSSTGGSGTTSGENVTSGGSQEGMEGNVSGGITAGENTPAGDTPGGNAPAGGEAGESAAEDTFDLENQDLSVGEAVPEEVDEPEQIININEEEIPIGNFKEDGTIAAANRAHLRSAWIAAGIGILAVIAVIVGAYVYRRMRMSGIGRNESGGREGGQ